MKKSFKNLAIAGMVGLASISFMTGCKKEDPKQPASQPYIEVQGLDTGYFVGESLDVEGAKVLYYSSKDDTIADEIALESSMVANFNTETAGEKKMKVFWNNHELEINYSVITTETFINVFNTAYNNLLNVENVYMEATGTMPEYEDLVQKLYVNVLNNKCYLHMCTILNQEESISNMNLWCEQYNNVWYLYVQDDSEFTRSVSEDIHNNNVMEYVIPRFTFIKSSLDEELFNALKNVDYEINGNQVILSYTYCDGVSESKDFKIYIENEKIVRVDCFLYEDEEGTEVESVMSEIISYNAEDVKMVDLPRDVQWKDYE